MINIFASLNQTEIRPKIMSNVRTSLGRTSKQDVTLLNRYPNCHFIFLSLIRDLKQPWKNSTERIIIRKLFPNDFANPPSFSFTTTYYKMFQSFFFSVYIATPFMTSGMSSSLFSLLKLLYILTYLPFTSALTSSIENE